ncbi:Uncharacterized membrane protein YccC [Rhizobiales bacterium GAS113]|nr:Uncharacterized membrane protein YccC [Rhizobiales bacterium GAS113]
MSAALDEPGWIGARNSPTQLGTALANAVRVAGPPLLFGVRLWASVCLALYVAFWLELDNAYWAGTSAALVCQPHLGASLRKGWYRMNGTLVGAVAIVVLTAWFPQDRAAFLVGLALWGAACALLATLLRNFAAYSAALAGYTAAIIASDQLGATGGPNGQAFMLAVTRASEICIGIVCAGVVLAATDFGAARRRLAELLAALSAEIVGRFANTLAQGGSELAETQSVRRELLRRVIALDPVIDEVMGESSRLRHHSPVLQAAVEGLFAALAGWRTAAVRLARLPDRAARREADVVLWHVPQELRSRPDKGEPISWMADPVHLRRLCDGAAQALIDLPASTPSLRLLADQTAKVLAGMSHALEGLALLVADPARARSRRHGTRLHVPDLLPSLVNAGRAFITIGTVEVFWIVTAWPNGALTMAWAAISVILFAPRADEAYTTAMSFMVGTGLAAVFAAIIAFALLPSVATFAGFSIVMALYLVPVGALVAQPWRTAMFAPMAGNFIPLLAPANQMSYDTAQFYNAALAIVAGIGAAALAFRLLPPLSPAFRTRRLLALTLRDLRRLAMSPTPRTANDWERRIYGRISALPEQAEPLPRAQILAALSVGAEIIRLRRIARGLDLNAELDAALDAMARGDISGATERLSRLDWMLEHDPKKWTPILGEDHAQNNNLERDDSKRNDRALAAPLGTRPGEQATLRVRGSIVAVSEAITQHSPYFGSRGAG